MKLELEDLSLEDQRLAHKSVIALDRGAQDSAGFCFWRAPNDPRPRREYRDPYKVLVDEHPFTNR